MKTKYCNILFVVNQNDDFLILRGHFYVFKF